MVLEQESLLPLVASYALTRVAASGCGPDTPTSPTSQPEVVLTLASQLGYALRDSGHSQLTLSCSASVCNIDSGDDRANVCFIVCIIVLPTHYLFDLLNALPFLPSLLLLLLLTSLRC